MLTNGLANAKRLAKSKEERADPPSFEQANQLAASHQLEEAGRPFTATCSSANPMARRCLGKPVESPELGRIAEARAYFERAIAANRNFHWAHVGLSEILEASGEYDAAIHALEFAVALDGSLGFAHERIQSIRGKRRLEIERIKGVQIKRWAANVRPDPDPGAKSSRPVVAVVAWDLTHNPVGRALALAEVAFPNAECEIVGPMFPKYGEDLWQPLRESLRPFDVRGFHAHSFTSFMVYHPAAAEKPCDVAWVSKPRLPSLLIGFLYKLMHGASVLLDIDDDELAADADEPLSLILSCEMRAPDWEGTVREALDPACGIDDRVG